MHNGLYEREANFLGALMCDTVKITQEMESIKPHWLTTNRMHAEIYMAWMGLHARSEPTDLVSVHDEVMQKGNLPFELQNGLMSYLADLVSNCVTIGATIRRDIYRIADAGRRVDARQKFIEGVRLIDESESYEDGLASALSCIDVCDNDGADDGLITVQELMQVGLSYISDVVENGFTGLKTGISELDDLMYGGFRKGELITVFGPPKSGKTTAATTMLENISMSKVHDRSPVVLVISREMGKVQLAARMMSSLGGVAQKNIMLGKMDYQGYDGITMAVSRVADAKIIYDLTSNTPSQVALKAAQTRRKYGHLDLIMVDHVGLMTSDKPRKSRSEEVTDITWALKTMARKQDVPVLLVAQQNRRYADRKDQAPTLADLAESSSIEKDSDVLVGVQSNLGDEMHGWTVLHVVGIRIGEQGTAVTTFKNGRLVNGDRATFEQDRQRASKQQKYSGGID